MPLRSPAVLLAAVLPLATLGGCKVAHAGQAASAPADTATGTYAKIVENDFRDVGSAPLSTFGLDVDTASYGNVRALLRSGTLPPANAVRVEEFVNAFRYHDPHPDGADALAATTEVQACPWAPDHWLLRIGVRARDVEAGQAPPANLVFLIDVSGSMQPDDRLPLVKRALAVLIDHLRPQDRIAIVTYANGVNVPIAVATGSDTADIRRVVDGLRAAGSTNGASGLRTAYRVAQDLRPRGETGRVILVSDGDFNVGVQTPAELRELVRRERSSGTFLTVLGCGRDNLRDDNLEAMADSGNGTYHYLDGMPTARKLFGSRFDEQMFCVAKDAKVQVEWNPTHVASWRLLGYENRLLGARDFANAGKDGGEVGAGQSVTALYELVPRRGAGHDGVPLRYRAEAAAPTGRHADELLRVSLCWQAPAGGDTVVRECLVAARDVASAPPSHDFQVAATAASFAMLLRESRHRGQLDWPVLQRMTDRLDGEVVAEHELAELVDRAAQLCGVVGTR